MSQLKCPGKTGAFLVIFGHLQITVVKQQTTTHEKEVNPF
jgi:hypothetical protein